MNAVLSDPAVLSIKKTPNINDLVKAKLRSQIGRKRTKETTKLPSSNNVFIIFCLIVI
jgi:hypothetical protein